MKFNCGLTFVEKWEMLCEKERRLNIVAPPDWERVFAFFPTRVAKGDCRWFEYVEQQKYRFRVRGGLSGLYLDYDVRYRAIEPV